MNKYDFDRELERAMFFVTQALEPFKDQHNKAVALHSVRVALSLYDYHNLDLVIAAALHDVVEDAGVALDDIAQAFGPNVAQLVAANTYDTANPDKVERQKEMFRRCKAHGKEALLIKAADIYDNSFYYPLRSPAGHVAYLVEKMRHFIELSEPELKSETIWQKLNDRYQQLSANYPAPN